jgi:hypothetical protein
MPDACGEAALERLAETRAVQPLVSLLGHKQLGGIASRVLGEIGDSHAVEPLAAALNNEDVRNEAAKALLKLGDSRGLKPLLTAYASTHPMSFFRECGDSILQYGANHRASLVSFLNAELESNRCRYAAELLHRFGELSATQFLPAVILDWLLLTRGEGYQKDEWLKAMAVRAGLDMETLALATAVLGNTYEGWSWKDEPKLDMSSVSKLCQRQDIWSSCVLYRVAKKKDLTVQYIGGANDEGVSFSDRTLGFDEEIRIARRELTRRGFGETDPTLQLSAPRAR